MPIPNGMNKRSTPHLLAKFAAYQRVLGYSQRTIDRREWSLRHWQRHLDALGSTLGAPLVEDLELFLARWTSPQSRYSIRSDVRQFYVWAIRRGHLDCANPTDELDPAKVPSRAASPIPADDVLRLIGACVRPVDRLMVMLASYAGLRTAEIAALRGEDVDLAAAQLVVRNGKGGDDEVIPLGREMLAELGRAPRAGRLVPMQGGSVGDRIRTMMRALGIDGRPHDLRHSFGTQAARKTNGNLVLVAKLMRHKRISTTTRYVAWHTTGHEVVSGLYGDAA